MSELESIDIRPGVNILAVLKNLNYKPWYALAEFVDNALQSFLDAAEDGRSGSQSSVCVWLEVNQAGSNVIRIRDDAFGISAVDFPRAFKAADVPPDNSGLSEFGMGMKSAATWFSQVWSVRTSVIGEPVQRSVEFDLRAISANGIEVLPVRPSPGSPDSHFTTIEMSSLNHMPRGRTVDKIKKHLGSIYRKFLRDGTLKLYYNGEALVFDEVQVLTAKPAWEDEPAVQWRKDIEVALSDGRVASGFVALRAVGSTSEAGLSLFRRNRLIMGSHDETYRPADLFGSSNTYVYQRLFGELDLEGFEVSYTKDGVQWDDAEEEFVEKLTDEIRRGSLDLVRQARQVRLKEASAEQRSAVETSPREVTDVFAGRLSNVEAGAESSSDSSPDLPDAIKEHPGEPVALSFSNEVTVETHRGSWTIALSASFDESLEDWIEIGAEVRTAAGGKQSTRLAIKVSMTHPFTQRFVGATGESSDAILSMACAIAISATMAKRAGVQSGQFVHFLNKTLRAAFEIGEAVV